MSPGRCFLQTLRECCTNLACAPFFLLALGFYSIYYCWPYRAQLPDHISGVIVDEDDSPLSRRLARALMATPRIAVKEVTNNRERAIQLMMAEQVITIIGIPPNFEKDAANGVATA